MSERAEDGVIRCLSVYCREMAVECSCGATAPQEKSPRTTVLVRGSFWATSNNMFTCRTGYNMGPTRNLPRRSLVVVFWLICACRSSAVALRTVMALLISSTCAFASWVPAR